MLRRPRRLEPLPWKYDWRNPDMVVHTGWMDEVGPGFWQMKRGDLPPEEVQQIARESLANSQSPDWYKDKTYY